MRPATVSWDPAYTEERDPLPPVTPIPPCRPCLGTGVVLDMAAPSGKRWTYGCERCGVGVEL